MGGKHLLDNGLGTTVQEQRSPGSQENQMIRHIERKRALEKYQKEIDAMAKGTLDAPGFLRQIVPHMLEGLLATSELTSSDRLRTAIQQDLLDRAGYGKISKAVTVNAVVDANTSRRELMNLIMTKAKRAGVKVQRKHEDEDGNDVIDVGSTVLSSKEPTPGTDSNANQVRDESDEFASTDSSDETGDL